MGKEKARYETDNEKLKVGIKRKVDHFVKYEGKVTFKAIPKLALHYAATLRRIWESMGKVCSGKEFSDFVDDIEEIATTAFEESPYSLIHISYSQNANNPEALKYQIDIEVKGAYDKEWLEAHAKDAFGALPDRKLFNLVRFNHEDYALDLGCGEGRNTIHLLNEGWDVVAVDNSKELLDRLRAKVSPANLQLRTVLADVENLVVKEDFSLIFFSEVATHFRSVNQLKRVCDLARTNLKWGGMLLFNAFVAKEGYQPSELFLQAAEAAWSPVFTHKQIMSAVPDCLELVNEVPALEYEREHTLPENWPPTPWFESWCRCEDIAELRALRVPAELRWFTFVKHREG